MKKLSTGYGVSLVPAGSGLNRIANISKKKREDFIKKLSALEITIIY